MEECSKKDIKKGESVDSRVAFVGLAFIGFGFVGSFWQKSTRPRKGYGVERSGTSSILPQRLLGRSLRAPCVGVTKCFEGSLEPVVARSNVVRRGFEKCFGTEVRN